MVKYLRLLFFIVFLSVCCWVQAREYLVSPRWYTGTSSFREAVMDKDGRLIDSYNRMKSDTVNVVDIQAQGEYSLDISFSINNLHGEPFKKYPQYFLNNDGKVKRGGSIERPVYGWVWGMKDMQHYNAVLMRASRSDDALYMSDDVEYCVLTVNGNDTTYHTQWRNCRYKNNAYNSGLYNMWIQYSNNTAWIGGGWNFDVPWTIAYNMPCFGNLTGLYLGAASKVSIENVFISVDDKDVLQHTDWTTESLCSYFSNSKDLNPIEGFWRIPDDKFRVNNVELGGDYELAIVANGDSFDILYLSGADVYPGKWTEGMVKGCIKPTNNHYYHGYWYDAEGLKIDNVISYSFANKLYFQFESEDVTVFMLPSQHTPVKIDNNNSGGQGTGFALTSDGYIATNYHVAEGFTSFRVYKGNDNRISYNAELVVADSIHDLAILRINDAEFTTLGDIPYGFENRNVRAGEELFYLGYPKTNYLGYGIKNSIGNVSSVNGNSYYDYMVSVEIDNGSSGSPIFDVDGDVVGIVYAKNGNDDLRVTANYVIKSPYLYKLIEQLPSPITLPMSKVKELSYPDKIEAITPYIFLIRTVN